MSKELKPCPFCGGKATLKAANKSWGFVRMGIRARLENLLLVVMKAEER